ncbi:MAG: hypothetical protein ACI4TX_03525, partial [Christensenellales bacterium]
MDNLKIAYDKAFDLGDYETCIRIASKRQNFNVDLSALKNAVINERNPLCAFYYVRLLRPKDKSEFEKVIIESNNANIATRYAIENKYDCNVEKLEQVILKFGDSFDSAEFISFIDSVNLEAHKNLILGEEEGYACYLYCKKFQPFGKELEKFQDIIIESEDAELAYLFARDIYEADLIKLGDVVLENGDVEDIMSFASLLDDKSCSFMSNNIGKVELNNIINVILNSPIASFASLQKRIENHILKYGTLDDICTYGLCINSADMDVVQNIIDNSDRKDLKIDLAFDMDVDLDKVVKSIYKDQRKPTYKVKMKN